MSQSNIYREQTITLMIHRTFDAFGTQRTSADEALLRRIMSCAYNLGYRPEHLVMLKHNRLVGYGFFRDTKHIVSAIPANTVDPNNYTGNLAVMVTTLATLGGTWVFMADRDGDLLIARNRQACIEADGLTGFELLDGIVTSALTEPLDVPPARRRLWRRQ